MLIRARVLEYRRTFRYSREQPTATLVPDFCLSPNYISLAFLGAWWRFYSFLSLSFRSKNRAEMLSSSSLNGCRFSVFPRCLDRPRRCRSYRSSCLRDARGLCLLCLTVFGSFRWKTPAETSSSSSLNDCRFSCTLLLRVSPL